MSSRRFGNFPPLGVAALCVATATLGAADSAAPASSKPAPAAVTNAAAEAPAAPDAPKEKEHESPLHLTEEKRRAAGIVLTKPSRLELQPAVEAYGRVLDPTPLVALLAEGDTAQAALVASAKELQRVTTLFQQGANASAQAVEGAEANVVRDRAAANSARLRLVASWGRAFADAVRGRQLREALEQGAVLARLDVLPGEAPAEPLTRVAVRLAGGGPTARAQVLGRAPVADPQIQGQGLLLLLPEGAFPVGAALRATLPGAGRATAALTVPRSAIVYHQGSAWAYTLGEKDVFERKLVTLLRPVGSDVALSGGVEPDDQVVTVGAEQLLAAELQGAGGAED